MGRGSSFVALLLVVSGLMACAPSSPARSTPKVEPESLAVAPSRLERTLVMALRVEPQTIAAKPLGPRGVALKHSARLFNALLDLIARANTP
jgi:hypothetical protein